MKIIVANFKMNGSRAFMADYFSRFKGSAKHQIIFCPPFPYLDQVRQALPQSPQVFLGGQDCSPVSVGARTGEVSASMLADMGCKYVILGHSERRQHQNEPSSLIKEKAHEAIVSGLIPIICVGETLEQRNQGITNDVILEQLKESVPESGQYIIAYEPVWAIGTGQSATTQDIEIIFDMIKDQKAYSSVSVLYGGSVKPDNIAQILSLINVDGVLVGGACLDVNQMNAMAE